MDLATAELVTALLAADVEKLRKQSRAELRGNDLTDTDLIYSVHLASLRTQLQLFRDRRIVIGINNACREDTGAIREALVEEDQAAQDHDRALQLAGLRNRPGQIQNSTAQNIQQNTGATGLRPLPESMTAGNVELNAYQATAVFSIAQRTTAVSSVAPRKRAAEEIADENGQRKRPRPDGTFRDSEPADNRVECQICASTKLPSEVTTLDCKPKPHVWCRDCITRVFELATRDEQMFPPTCCHHPITLQMAEQFLTPQLKGLFVKKAVEYTTTDRTYCFQSRCSTFIPKPQIQHGVATCPRCKCKTCSTCKRKMHEKDDCSEDPAIQSLNETANREGWRRCTKCGRMIELTVGCYHVRWVTLVRFRNSKLMIRSCLCGHQFCHLCGAIWKTCKCPTADENRVIFRAQRAQEEAARAQRAAAAEARTREIDQRQRNCDHSQGAGTWKQADGGACTMCRTNNPWLMECPRCEIRVCHSCRLTKVN